MSTWNTKLSIQSLQNQINKITLAGAIQNPLLADINANNKDITEAGTISAVNLITKNLEIDSNLSCDILTANTINCSNIQPPIPNGKDGRNAFNINLLGGATYGDDLTIIKTNSSNGYAITTNAYQSGCYVSGYSTRQNAVYIGLTETTTITDPSNPASSFSHMLYSNNLYIYRLDNGVVSTSVPYPNSNPNFTFSVEYDNTNIKFFCDGVELVGLKLNVGENKSYYGVWCSYLDKTISNIQFSPIVVGAQGIQGIQGIQGEKGTQGIQGIQGEQGIQGIQGIQGEKGESGSLANPVVFTDTFKFNNNDNFTMADFDNTNKQITLQSGTKGLLSTGIINLNAIEMTVSLRENEILKVSPVGVVVPNFAGILLSGDSGLSNVYDKYYNPIKTVAKSLINLMPSALFVGITKLSVLTWDINSIMPNATCIDLTLNALNFTWSNQNMEVTKTFTGYLFLSNIKDGAYNPIAGSAYPIQFIYSISNSKFSSGYTPINLKFYNQGAGSNINTLYLNMSFDSPTVQLQITLMSGEATMEVSIPNTPLTLNPIVAV